MWGSFFFVGSETPRIHTKLSDAKKKAGTPEWAGDTLLTWLVSKGSDVEKIVIKDDKEGGVGAYITQDVNAGEIIAEMPYLTSIGPEAAAKHAYSQFLLTLYGDKDFPGQFAAAFHLLLEVAPSASLAPPPLPSPSLLHNSLPMQMPTSLPTPTRTEATRHCGTCKPHDELLAYCVISAVVEAHPHLTPYPPPSTLRSRPRAAHSTSTSRPCPSPATPPSTSRSTGTGTTTCVLRALCRF